MQYQYKYAVHTENGKQKGSGKPGRYVDPDSWCTGPDPVRHDKYYAYLKHQAQAKFRKEQHTLTWDQWEALWPDELWHQRGRKAHNLCLQQTAPGLGWHWSTVEVVPRRKHFQDIKERNRVKS